MANPIKIGNNVLCDGTYKSGAVFLLSNKADIIFSKDYSKIIKNWMISIEDKSKLIVAKTKRKIKPNKIHEVAYNAVQEFLDCISVEINHFNSLKNHLNYIIWYEETSNTILEINSRSTINIKSGTQVRIKPIDKRKKERILKNEIKTYHSALRYFRLSRTTSDFIECFRNQYLAFEQLLSSISQKSNKGREWEWISRVLNISKKKYEIAKILSCNVTDISTTFKSKIYSIRLELFHAKKNQSHYLPGDLIRKREVINSLHLIEMINWLLIDEHYNTTFSRGGVLLNGLQSIVTNFCSKEKQFKILISNKIGSIDEKLDDETKSQHIINDANYEIQNLSARIFTDFKINNEILNLNKLSRTCILGNAGLYTINQLEESLVLTDIVNILRINEYIDFTSDDFHKFFN